MSILSLPGCEIHEGIINKIPVRSEVPPTTQAPMYSPTTVTKHLLCAERQTRSGASVKRRTVMDQGSLVTQAGGAPPHRALGQRGRFGMREAKGRTDFVLSQGDKAWVWEG